MDIAGCAARRAVMAGKAWRMSPIAPSRTMRTRNCLLCGGNALFSHREAGQMAGYGWLVFEGDFETRDVERREPGALLRVEAHEVLLRGDEGIGVVAGAESEKRAPGGDGGDVVVGAGGSL